MNIRQFLAQMHSTNLVMIYIYVKFTNFLFNQIGYTE